MNTGIRLRIGLLTMAPFPIGNVSTLRFTSYLEALVRNGAYAKVIIYSPTTMAKHISERQGTFKGIEFEYATRITWGKYKNNIVKFYYLIVGLLGSLKILRKDNINTVILYGDNPSIVNLFVKIACIIFSCRYIGDRSEYPTEKQRSSKLKMSLYKFKNSLFDGMIVMTRELERFYSSILANSKKTLLLPMTIDTHRFDQATLKESNKKYIAVVFGVHNRDGLYESIGSYFQYKNQGGKYSLKIIGDFERMPNKNDLLELIESQVYEVEIMGMMPITEVPNILANASCLLTTPNYYVSGGFPTKLGEYMLSGVPVVATRVGELEDFVTNNYDIILAEAGNIVEISEKLLWVEKHPEQAKKIAIKAYETASHDFSADTYISQLSEFLQNQI